MKRVLFVCTGNICRSPTAEGIFRHIVHKENFHKLFEIDSAGLTGYHEGEGPDRRTQEAAKKRGYDLSSIRSRPLEREDFHNFDYFIAMDRTHLEAMVELCPANLRETKTIKLMMDYSQKWSGHDVPDPYYGGGKGFELVLDMLEEACHNLFNEIKK